jgi:molybdopterin converting factor small subunit
MRIRLSLLGILAEYTGFSNVEIELKGRATIKDLLNEVGDKFGDSFPPQVWDPERRAFSPTIGVFLDLKDVEDEDTPLKEGCEVILLPLIAGGA